MKQLYNGIFLLGRFGEAKCGAWLLLSGNEAALFEMPDYSKEEISPCFIAKNFIQSNNLHLRYVLLSHPHLDHYGSILEYRKVFKDAKFIGHKIFSYIINYKCSAELLKRPELWRAMPNFDRVFNYLFEEETLELPLGNKSISIIYAPKHSPGDTILYFNKVLFTGDWWMLEGDPGNCEEVACISNISIKRVVDYIHKKNLPVKHMFPSHANNFLYNIDLYEVMQRTLMPENRKKSKNCPVKLITTL